MLFSAVETPEELDHRDQTGQDRHWSRKMQYRHYHWVSHHWRLQQGMSKNVLAFSGASEACGHWQCTNGYD